jgi:hypothetical protein
MSRPLRRHGKADRFSAPERRYPLNLEVLLRERGMAARSDGRGIAAGADDDRSSSCALVVAWVMPEIVLVFRNPERFLFGGSLPKGSRAYRVETGMVLHIRTPFQAKF